MQSEYPALRRRPGSPLAGLVMWIPAGLLLTMIGVGLSAAWLGEAVRRAAT